MLHFYIENQAIVLAGKFICVKQEKLHAAPFSLPPSREYNYHAYADIVHTQSVPKVSNRTQLEVMCCVPLASDCFLSVNQNCHQNV